MGSTLPCIGDDIIGTTPQIEQAKLNRESAPRHFSEALRDFDLFNNRQQNTFVQPREPYDFVWPSSTVNSFLDGEQFCRLSEELVEDPAVNVGQAVITAAIAEREPGVIDAQLVQQRGMDVMDVDGSVDD